MKCYVLLVHRFLSSLLLLLSALTLLSLLTISVSASAGLNPPPLEQRQLTFEPGLSKTWNFHLFGSERLEAFLGGDLVEYAVLEDPTPNGSARSVSVTLTLPNELAPGRYVLYLYSREASSGGMIGARAAVGAGMVVISLYPTPYLKAKLEASDTAVGSSTVAKLSLTSWSSVTAPDVWADLVVKDQKGVERLTTASRHVQVPAQGSQKILVPLQTSSLEPGRYTVEAFIHGAQPNLSTKTSFKIGTLDLKLQDYTKELSASAINRFSFTIENRWNQQLHNLYGVVRFPGLEEKTPTTTIKGFGSADFRTYLDLSKLNVTTNTTLNGNLTVHYMTPEGEGGEKFFPLAVVVVPEQVAASDLSPEEVQQTRGFFIPLNSMTLLYLSLLLLVIINLFLLFRRGGKEEIVIKPPEVR